MSDIDSLSPRKYTEPSSLRGAEPKRKSKKKQPQRAKSPERILPFLEADEFSDVTILVGEKRLFFNKCLLCYNSSIFREQLVGDGSGGKGKGSKGSKDLDLSEKRYDDVCELLAFMDPRVDTNLTEEDAIRLLPLADEYDVKPLTKSCGFTITQSYYKQRKGRRPGNINTEITVRNLILADKYNFKDLQEMCIDELVKSDNPYSGKLVSENKDLSEYMKRQVLERKLEKLNLALVRERRLRTERNLPETGKGDKIWKK